MLLQPPCCPPCLPPLSPLPRALQLATRVWPQPSVLPGGCPHGSWCMAEEKDVCWKCWIESHRCSHLAILYLNICQQLLRPGLMTGKGQMGLTCLYYLTVCGSEVWFSWLVCSGSLRAKIKVLGRPGLTGMLLGIIRL